MKQLLLLALLVPSILFAQTNYEDVVYLKNGSVIHGVIIENVPNVSIKIKNNSGDIFFYKIDEIQKMTKEEPVTNKPEVKQKSVDKENPKFSFDNVKKHVTCSIDIGGIFGVPHTWNNPDNYYGQSQKFSTDMFELRVIVEDMITKRFSIGAGFNLDISGNDPLTGSGSTSLIIPFYLNVKYCFLKRRFSPFLAAQAGGGIYWSDYNRVGGNAMCAVQGGLRAFVSNRTALNVGLGYRFQFLDVKEPTSYYSNQPSSLTALLHFISLNFGVTF